MLADRVRVEAYAQALRQTIRPGGVVVDIGTGTGIFALLACQAGARRVYAIEPDDIIQVARALAKGNGVADRIVFLQERSSHVTLPEPADVIVSDLRGVLPFHRDHLPTIIDARTRFLARGGTLIPRRDFLWVAPVQAPDLYRQVVEPWDGPRYGLNFAAARDLAINAWSKARVRPHELATEPRRLAVIDYATVRDSNLSVEVSWTAGRDEIVHGICVWFDTELLEGIGFSNAPNAPERVYGGGFFPLAEPIALERGDIVAVTLHADLVGEDYVWRWDTRVHSQGETDRLKAAFAQSNVAGTPLSPVWLTKQTAGSASGRAICEPVPVTSEKGSSTA